MELTLSSLLHLWMALGWSRVTVVMVGKLPRASCALITSEASRFGIAAACWEKTLTCDEMPAIDGPLTVVNWSGTVSGMELVRAAVAPQRRPYEVIHVEADVENNLDFEEVMGELGFLRALWKEDQSSFDLYRVQTFRKKKTVVENKWDVNLATGMVSRTFDLHGAPVTCLSKSWMSWVVLHDCDANGKDCKSKGILSEAMDIWASVFNFTWSVDEADGWGVFPLTGAVEHGNATWGGAMGAAFNDEYDLPLGKDIIRYT